MNSKKFSDEISQELKEEATIQSKRNLLFHSKWVESKNDAYRAACIVENIPLIYSRVNELSANKKSLEKDSLFNEGVIGFIKGFNHFHPKCGAAVSTYVSYWIDAEIRMAMKKSFTVRVFTSYEKEKAYAVLSELEKKQSLSEINTEDLSKKLLIRKEIIDEIKDLLINNELAQKKVLLPKNLLDIDSSSNEEIDPSFFEKRRQFSPFELLSTAELKNNLSIEIEKLDSETEDVVLKEIIDKRFRLRLRGEQISLEEIAETFNGDKQRMHQLESKIKEILQKRLGVFKVKNKKDFGAETSQ